MKDFLSVGHVARLLGVTTKTIRNWADRGHLKCVRHPINNHRFFKRDDLKELIEKIGVKDTN